jgi:hypothetical protein
MMDNALRAFYLDQLGIESWVFRPKRADASPVLIVLEVSEPAPEQAQFSWPEGKEGQLLKRMMHSIGLTPEHVSLLYAPTDNTRLEALLSARLSLNPQCILLLGESNSLIMQQQRLESSAQGITVIMGIHPKELLNHPIKKRAAYSALLGLKQTLGRCE